MIVSASRRTDIPAYYSDWFFKRLEAQSVIIINPMNPRQASSISLSPDIVDGIVFWTKNPVPMLDRLGELRDYAYYFQFTLTAYGADIEPGIPPKSEMITAFRRLADRIGPERVIWRYDPVLLSDRYTVAYHEEAFGSFAEKLNGYSNKCIFSFIDEYRHIRRSLNALNARALTEAEIRRLAKNLAGSARANGMTPETCAEEIELAEYGAGHARCIDPRIFQSMTGQRLETGRDRAQRPACGCAASIDIGAYNTCPAGCRYCYANHSETTIRKRRAQYDPASPALCSYVQDAEKVLPKAVKSHKTGQITLYD
jgi:DNA repair photolyase